MRVVVSGASGFLGSHLVAQLIKDGVVHVTGLVFEAERLEELRAISDGNEQLTYVSSSDAEATKDALRQANVLVHAAFPRAQADSALAAGMRYGNELFGWAQSCGCAVVHISSQSVYDAYRTYAATESSPLVLDSTYATAKYAGELMLADVCRDVPYTNVRLASLIGAGFDQRVTNKMALRALAGNDIAVQDGRQTFDFMDVRDAASALSALVRSDAHGWQPVYNLGSMQPTTLLRIAELVADAVPSEVEVVHEPANTEPVPNSSLDASLFRKDFAWRHRYSMVDSIRDIVAHASN